MRYKGKMKRPIWWDWATFDDDGFLNGIAPDAPEDMKKAYQEYLKEEEQRKKQGIKY